MVRSMLLEDILSRYASRHLRDGREWYQWNIDSERLRELGITVSGQNSFERNVDLKRKLSRRWHRHSEDRTRLTQFYVAGWGRIRSNAPKTLQEFAIAPAEQLIARGYMGVASWSKVLVMHDPDKYAIFDARVAAALNGLQLQDQSTNPTLFPILSSRNRAIADSARLFRSVAQRVCWSRLGARVFYREYLSLISAVASRISQPIYVIEMLLFAKAKEIVADASRSALPLQARHRSLGSAPANGRLSAIKR